MKVKTFAILAVLLMILAQATAHAVNDWIAFPKLDWPYPYPVSFTVYSTADPTTLWNPWSAKIINTEPVFLKWVFDSREHSKRTFSVMRVSGKTRKPYPGQTNIYLANHNSAVVKIYVRGHSACQDLYDTCSGYSGTLQGDGLARLIRIGYEDYSDCNQCTITQTLMSLYPTSHLCAFGQYRQLDYPFSPYGRNSGYTIMQLGCYMVSTGNIMMSYGFVKTPPEWNTALCAEPDGFIARVRVNPFAIQRIVGVNRVGFRSYVPLDEALARGCQVIVCVRDGGHWVAVTCFTIANENSPLQHWNIDPMDRADILENQTNYDPNNTRCWYLKDTIAFSPAPEGSAQSTSGSEGVIPSTEDISWGDSGLAAGSESPVTFDLLNSSGKVVENVKEPDFVESGENGARIAMPPTIIASQLPADNYVLRVRGASAQSYSVDIFDYDVHNSTPVKRTEQGTIGAGGYTDIPIIHFPQATITTLVPAENFVLGTTVCYTGLSNAVVTAPVPGGFYVQTAAKGIRPIFVQSQVSAVFGQAVLGFAGQVMQTASGQKFISASSVSLGDGSGTPFPTAVGLSPKKASTSWHQFAKTFGKITAKSATDFTLEGNLSVECATVHPVGSFVTVGGVEHEGCFYADSSEISLVQ